MNRQPEAAPAASEPREPAALLPPVDVVEDAQGITLWADMPGVAREALNVHVEGDTLTLEAAIGLQAPPNRVAQHVEVALPRYRRAFTLSRELDAAKVTASFEHGVLKLRIPKAGHAQPRRIEVKAG